MQLRCEKMFSILYFDVRYDAMTKKCIDNMQTSLKELVATVKTPYEIESIDHIHFRFFELLAH